MNEDCRCDQCSRAEKIVRFAEDQGFDLQDWQLAVIRNLAKCSRSAVRDGKHWLRNAMEDAQRRQSQLPPWARPTVRPKPVARSEQLHALRDLRGPTDV